MRLNILPLFFLALSSFFALGALNPKTDLQEYLRYGQSDHFSAIGVISVTSKDGRMSDCGTATLIKKNMILTAAHNFDGVSELGRNNIAFKLNGIFYKVLDYNTHPDFRKGGPDMAVAFLEKTPENIAFPTIGKISNEDLYEKIWGDIRCSPDAKDDPKYIFSSAGFGRVGPWTEGQKSMIRREERIGFVLKFQSNTTLSTTDQHPIPEVVFCAYPRGEHALDAGSTFGFSGSPVFVMNQKSEQPKWRLIGLIKSGDKLTDEHHVWKTLITPINGNAWLDQLISH